MNRSEPDLSNVPSEADRNLLTSIFERVTDAFVALDKNWRYTYVNARAGEIFGRNPKDLIGKHIWTEFPEGFGRPFHLAYERAMADQKAVRFEEYYAPYGRWFENIVYPSPDGLSIYFHDITVSKQAEAFITGQKNVLELIANGVPLGESLNALLRLLELQAPDMVCSIVLLDPDGIHVRHGAAPSLPKAFIEAIDGQKIGPVAGSCGTAMHRREMVVVEDIAVDPLWEAYRGLALPLGLRACWSTPIVDAENRVLGSYAIYYRKPCTPMEVHRKLIGIATHIASIAITRQRSEESLRESGARYRRIVETSQEGIWTIDAQARTSFVNPKLAEMLHYTVEEMLGRPLVDFMDEQWKAVAKKNLTRRKEGISEQHEFAFQCKDGTLLYALLSTNPIYDANGVYVGALAMVTDISERKRAEDALRESEARYRKLFEYAPLGIVIADSQSVYLDANPSACQMLGYERNELIGLHATNIVAPEEVKFIDPALSEIRTRLDYHREWRLRRKDGSIFDAEVDATVMPDGTLLGIFRDVTERRKAAAALCESEERFRQLAENVREVFWVKDIATNRFLYAGPLYEPTWGRSRQSLYSDPETWQKAIHSSDRDRVQQAAAGQVLGTYDEIYRIVRPDGSIRWIRDRAFPVRCPSGEVQRIVGSAMDITEQRNLEEQFHQAQKMEAIGQLAGGVAHDFNNLLMIISGHVQLLLGNLPPNDPLHQELEPIRSTAERATELTRQLLALSRKQTLELRVLDLNQVIAGSESILRRVTGEKIALEMQLDKSLDKVKADAGQLGQVLLNLVVNARDAMPKGGSVAIKTSNTVLDDSRDIPSLQIKAGKYVLLEVSDTGSGISKDVLAHIFEPFYTTKEPEKGTGLGLAVVHGIVKQSGGHIEVFSEQDAGATFKIYLPAA